MRYPENPEPEDDDKRYTIVQKKGKQMQPQHYENQVVTVTYQDTPLGPFLALCRTACILPYQIK